MVIWPYGPLLSPVPFILLAIAGGHNREICPNSSAPCLTYLPSPVTLNQPPQREGASEGKSNPTHLAQRWARMLRLSLTMDHPTLMAIITGQSPLVPSETPALYNTPTITSSKGQQGKIQKGMRQIGLNYKREGEEIQGRTGQQRRMILRSKVMRSWSGTGAV